MYDAGGRSSVAANSSGRAPSAAVGTIRRPSRLSTALTGGNGVGSRIEVAAKPGWASCTSTAEPAAASRFCRSRPQSMHASFDWAYAAAIE